MPLEEHHNSSTATTMEKPESQPLEKSPSGEATEDPEKHTIQEQQKDKEAAPANDSPAVPKLLLIAFGLWCAVFLVALVRHRSASHISYSFTGRLTEWERPSRTKPL